MTPEGWQRLKPLFDHAIKLPREERAIFVGQVARDDEELARNLADLLKEDQTGALDRPLLNWREVPLDSPGEAETIQATRTEISSGTERVVAGRFRLLRKVGHGGMGEVYEADDLQLKDRVALKMIRPEIAANPTIAERFKREILLGKKIAHPNVCRIHDLGSERPPGGPEMLFLTMEFLDGETLSSRIKRGAFSEKEAFPLIQNMADGLAAAHDAGVVHRDFKCGNVMLVNSGRTRAVITDFGLARPSRELTGHPDITSPGAVAGTVAYMAPEQIRGEVAKPASDIYSLGVVVYQMMTGRLPFQGGTDAVIAASHLHQAPPSPREYAPNLNPAWEAAILRCLSKAPEDRYSSAVEVASDLKGALSGSFSNLTAPKVSTPIDPEAVSKRWRNWLIAAGVLVFVALLFVVVSRFSRPRIPPRALELTVTAADRLSNASFLDASKVLEQVLLEAPHYARARAMLADAENELELTGRANREMNRISEADLRQADADDRYYIEGVRLTLTRDYAGAAEQFRKYWESGDEASKPGRAIILGRAFEKAQKTSEAIKAYESAGKRGGASLSLAVLDSRQQQIPKALAEFEEARKQFDTLGEHGAVAGLQYQLGAAYNRWGRLAEAEAADRGCVQQAGMVGDEFDLLRCRQQLATIALRKARTDEELAAVRGELMAIVEEAGHQGFQVVQARAWMSASQVDSQRNNLAESEHCLNEALTRAESEESTRMRALIQLARAALHLKTKQLPLAESEAAAAVQFFRQDGALKELAQALLFQGQLLQRQGRLEEALKRFGEQQVAASKVSPGDEAQALEAIGTVYQDQENYPAAAAQFRRALELDGNSAGSTYFRLELARVMVEVGHMDEAKAALAPIDAAKLLPRLATRLKLELARIQLSSGNSKGLRDNLTGLKADDPAVELIMGQADLQARNFRAASEKCGAAFAEQAKARNRHETAVSSICNAEAALGVGNAQKAIDILSANKTEWSTFPVERLRGMAIRGASLTAVGLNSDAESSLEEARSTASGLAALWGASDFQSFQNRADVRGNPTLMKIIHGANK